MSKTGSLKPYKANKQKVPPTASSSKQISKNNKFNKQLAGSIESTSFNKLTSKTKPVKSNSKTKSSSKNYNNSSNKGFSKLKTKNSEGSKETSGFSKKKKDFNQPSKHFNKNSKNFKGKHKNFSEKSTNFNKVEKTFTTETSNFNHKSKSFIHLDKDFNKEARGSGNLERNFDKKNKRSNQPESTFGESNRRFNKFSKYSNKSFNIDRKFGNFNNTNKHKTRSNSDIEQGTNARRIDNRFANNKTTFNKSSNTQLDSNNPILLQLEELFAILYKGPLQINHLLRQLKLNKSDSKSLNFILEALAKYNVINLAGKKLKFNLKYIKNTKIPKYFLLKVTSQNKLGEWLAVFPNIIKGLNKYTIVVEKTSFPLQENSYILAKINQANNNILKAAVLIAFPTFKPEIIMGLVHFINKIPYLVPLTRKHKFNFVIKNSNNFSLNEHALIEAEVTNASSFTKEASVTKVINNKDLTTELSLLTAYEFNLPLEFSQEVLQEAANKSGLPDTTNYKDLTNLPLVTIDGEDAKDFDDAVFVEQLSEFPLKYRVVVAIADVSAYVMAKGILDQEAKNRGNSTYLPGLVVPMLPPILSNTWCSLNPNQDRAALVADLIINSEGLIEEYSFYQAIINSKARLTYNEVEKAINGEANSKTKPLLETTIMPLYNIWQILNKAKIKRHALEIKANEYKVVFNQDNSINSMVKKEELISNKIIEELMIAANVAAAKFLQSHALESLTVFRIHDKPSALKLEHLAATLKALNIPVKIPKDLTGQFFNKLLQNKDPATLSILNESVLAAQSQAKYSTYNIGHFGLALKEYCHFTSPIRRYADLIIHRLISSVLNIEKVTSSKLEIEETANYISTQERNSAFAEYAAMEKITAKLLSHKIDCEFNARVVNITNAGLFVALSEMGAQGLVPMRTLGSERFIFSESRDKLIGVNSKKYYQIGQTLTVLLKEVNILKGLLTFIIK